MIEALIGGILALLGINTGYLMSVNYKLGRMVAGLEELEGRVARVEKRRAF